MQYSEISSLTSIARPFSPIDLTEIARFRERRRFLGVDFDHGAAPGSDEAEVCKFLRKQVQGDIDLSAYNFVRPSIFNIFDA